MHDSWVAPIAAAIIGAFVAIWSTTHNDYVTSVEFQQFERRVDDHFAALKDVLEVLRGRTH